MLHGLEGLTGNVDSTLVKTQSKHKDVNHSRCLNGRKRMLSFNINTVFVDDNGLLLSLLTLVIQGHYIMSHI